MTVYKKSCYTTVETFSSVKQLIAAYVDTFCDRKTVSNFYSSLLKYAMPALGFPAPTENRLDSVARDKYLDVLNTLPLLELKNLPVRLEEYFSKIRLSKSARRPIRSRINQFYDYFAENVLEPEERLIKRSSSGEIRFHRKNYGHSLRKIRTTDRTLIRHVDYDALDPKLYAKLKKEILAVEEFAENFLKQKRTDGKFKNIEKLATLVGWFHQVHGRDLSLSSIMRYIPLKATSKTKLNGKSVVEYETNQLILCREHSHEVIKDLEYFLNNCGHELKAGTKSNYIRSLKTLAKYLYQNDTDIFFYSKFEDIPIVQRLRTHDKGFQQDASLQTSNQTIDGKMITWGEVKEAVERSRLLADQTRYQSRTKIADTAKFVDYRRFLITSLLTIMPPGRQHIFRELIYGKSIVFGLFDEFNQFTSHEDLKEDETPIWYISLMPIEYKTGKTHKNWIVEIPNKEYSDGKKFYDYLYRWYFAYDRDEDGEWYGLRDAIKPLDDSFFPGSQTRKMASASNTSAFIKNIFYQATNVPLTAHTLRHIFNTYVRNLGASEAVLKSLAFWMQHKKETADLHYNQQNSRQQFKAGWDFVKDLL